jgi:hypothetical protein
MLESNPSAVAGDDVVLGKVSWPCPVHATIHYIVPKAINSCGRLRQSLPMELDIFSI